MKVSEAFNLYQGNSLELMRLKKSNISDVNFVSRTSQNNGVAAKVERIQNLTPFSNGLITVALGGSVLSSFVQPKPFYTAFHIMVLEPKFEMSLAEKLYYCMCFKANDYKYSFGRQANKTLKDVVIPDIIPVWVESTFGNTINQNVKLLQNLI